MAQEKSADQTELPTPKRLKDARKKGQIHRSQDLTKTVLILIWLVLFWLLAHYLYMHISAVMERAFLHIGQADRTLLLTDLRVAGEIFMRAMLPFLIFAATLGIFIEFLQVGPLVAAERVKPKLEHLNPAQGLKRVFSQENMVEVVKAVVKTGALFGIVVLVAFAVMDEYLALPYGHPADVLEVFWHGVLWIGVWTVFVFFFISVLDVVYQRFAYIRNLKMSRRDVRQEHRDTEGDPHVKGHRKELHREWSEQNMVAAVRGSNVVVTNPTHIAVALFYDRDETDLPVVVAKGEDYEARLIREAAEEADVPIMQNVELARGLHEDIAVDDYISEEFFEAVAEVLHWAETVRSGD